MEVRNRTRAAETHFDIEILKFRSWWLVVFGVSGLVWSGYDIVRGECGVVVRAEAR